MFYLPRNKRIGFMQRAGVLKGSGSSRSLVRFDDKVGFCLVLEELMIFDSVVADFDEIRRWEIVSKH